MQIKKFASIVMTISLLLLAGTAHAASYTWTNSASGVSGYWVNGTHWGQAAGIFPITTDSAYLTNTIASGAYTNIFDYTPGLGGPLAALVISNKSAGQACLIITNATLSANAFTLGNGGNIQIDNGGTLLTLGAVSFNAASMTALVSSVSSPGQGGTWNLNGQTMTLGNNVSYDNMTFSNVNLYNGLITVGFNSTANSIGNRMTIDSTILTNIGTIYVGYDIRNNGGASSSSQNALIATNGASLFTGAINVGLVTPGASASSNALTIVNSFVQANGALNMAIHSGENSTFYSQNWNTVTVNGGTLQGLTAINIGGSWGARSTSQRNNSLVITNGGYVSSSGALNIDAGGGSNQSNNFARIVGGTLSTVGGQIGSTAGQGHGYQKVQVIGGSGVNSVWNSGNGNISLSGSSASLTVDGAGVDGSAVVTNAGAVTINGPSDSLTLTNGARWFGNGALTIGSGASGCTMAIQPNTLYNGGGAAVTVGYNAGNFNTLYIGPSGVMTNVGAVTVGLCAAATVNNQLVVTGAGALLSSAGNLVVGGEQGFPGGDNANSNAVLIANNGVVTVTGGGLAVGAPGYGSNKNANFNSVTITNVGRLYTTATSYIGAGNYTSYADYANNNTVTIAGNSALWDMGSQTLYIGYGGVASTNNVLTVGSGGILTNASLITVGYNGGARFNSMVLTNASVFASNLTIGNSSSNNTVTIQDAESKWDFGGGVITVGSAAGAGTATGNVFNFVASSTLTNIGRINLYDRNAIWFLTNRCLAATVSGLNLGSPGLGGNSLTLSNQNFASSGATVIGSNGSTNNTMTVLGDVTWNVGGQNITVGVGTGATNTLNVSGGTVTNLGTITATGSVNTVVFNSGLISGSSAVLSNSLGTAFNVGDGTNCADYNAAVGTHSFNSGMLVASNSWLTGNGLVNAIGNVILTNGGCISPGYGTNGIGTLTVNTNIYGQNGAIYNVQINNIKGRVAVNWDMLRVNGTITNTSASTNFIIRMDSMGQALSGFSPTAGYSLPIATYSPAIDTNNFTIDTNLFLDGGNWRLVADKGTLYLVQDGSKVSGGTKCIWTSLTSDFWSTAAAWDTPPVQGGGSDYMLEFSGSGATSYTASNTWAGSFTNNTIIFNSGASVSNYLVGNSITFVNGANPAGFYQFTNGPFVVSNSIVLATNIVFDGEGVGRVVMSSNITGVGGISCIGGASETMLMASNTFAGPVLVNISGQLTLGHLGAIGTNSLTLSNGTVNAPLAGNSYIVGSGWSNQNVSIYGNGSIWTNAANFVIGTNAAVNNVVILANGGNLAATAVNIGNSAAAVGNGLVISNGGTVAGAPITVGSVANTTGSYFNVLGGGLATCGNITVGKAGAKYNTMTVSNATLSSTGLTIGNVASSNTVLVSGGTVSNFSGTVYIGYNNGTAGSNSLTINNGGQWYGGNVYVGYASGTSANNNRYNVGGPGAASTVSNGAIFVSGPQANDGSASPSYNTMVVSNATLQMGGQLSIGFGGNTMNNNQVIVDNQGTVQMGNNSIVICASSYGWPHWNNNGLIITNGGYLSAGALTVNKGDANNYVLVANGGILVTVAAPAINGLMTIVGGGSGGPTSTWNLTSTDLIVSGSGNSGTLTVDGNGLAGGAVVTNVAQLVVGNPGSGSGIMLMTNGAQVFATSVMLGKGTSTSSNNKLTIVGGAGLTSVLNAGGGTVTVGYLPVNSGSDNNKLIIGAGGILTNAGPMRVALATRSNWNGINNNLLAVTNGGQLFTTGNSFIVQETAGASGGTISGNSAIITGTGSLWSLGGGNLTVGQSASGSSIYTFNNTLTVNDGGALTNVALITVGSNNSAINNSMTVSNATVSSVGLTIGSSSYTNTVNVYSNSLWNFGGGNLTVGSGGATSNILAVSSGNIVTNVATLTVAAGNTLSLGAGVQLSVNAAIIPGNLGIGIDENMSPAVACVTAANNLNITGATLNLTAGLTVNSPCVIARYGTLTGTFAATNGLPAGCWINYSYGGNQIAVMPPISIANLGASGVSPSSATFNANLQVPRTNADVTVYWGETDGTNNPGAWDHSASVGSWANVVSVNISFTTNGLNMGTEYFYTFLATNSATNVWASPSTNFTVRNPGTRYWDGGTTNIADNGNGTSDGGAGTWNTSTNNWDQGNALVHVAWDNSFNDTAIFSGSPGVVTLAAAVWVGGLQFDTAGYTVWSNTLTFGTSGWINASADVTINSVIAGSVPVAKVGTGTLNNFGDNTLTGPFSIQTGKVVNTVNWVGNGRSGQQVQVGGYGSATLWTNTIAMVVGSGAAGISNTFTVASQGVLRVNGGLGVGTNGATFNSLVITNGGQVFSTAASYIGNNATNNSALVIGGGSVTSVWNLGSNTLTLGSGGTGNVLTVNGAGLAGGAVVTNLALGLSGRGNSVLLTNGAQVFNNAGAVSLSGSSNTLTVAGGAANSLFYGSSNQFNIAQAGGSPGSTCADNRVVIGAGGVMTNVGYYSGLPEIDFPVGWAQGTNGVAYGNQLVVTDGGILCTISNLSVGFVYGNGGDGGVASSNSLLIANGGYLRVPGSLYVGSDSSQATGRGTNYFNSITITNGGQLLTGRDSYIGRAIRAGTAANNNTATLGGSLNGTNALWNLGGSNLFVGSRTSGSATGNVLTVNAGGVVTNAASLTVSITNTLALGAGGKVYAGAVTNLGTLNITLDDTVSPACGRITATGNLNVTNATLNITANGTPSGSIYVLASYGSLNGSFLATNGMPSGYQLLTNSSQISMVLPGTPMVSNVGATNQGSGTSTLQGMLTGGGIASAWICWGTNDGGSTATSAWQNVVSMGDAVQNTVFSNAVSGLATNVTYWYRCFATNSYGTAWASPATWFNATPGFGGGSGGGGGFKMKVSFTNFNRAETLTNFPVLVVLSNNMVSSFDFGTFLSTNGYDLRFWNDTETTNLNYEIESWSTGSSAYVWVQVTNFTNNCYIWAKWGDSTQTNQPAYTTNGATWSQGYVGVWHMTQTNSQDSSTNRYSATSAGNTNAMGYVGSGQGFNQTQSVTFSGPTWTVNRFSVSFWLKPNSRANYNQQISAVNAWNAFNFHTEVNGGIYTGITAADANRFTPTQTGNNVLNTGSWNYWTFTCDASLSANLFRDGTKLAGPRTQGAPTVGWGGFRLFAGGAAQGVHGVADEVRISSVDRSANWVWAEYMTMASNSFFNTPGSVQVLSPIQNLAPTPIMNAAAILNASLSCSTTNYDVWVHWGTTDGTNNFGAWAANAYVGSYTNVTSQTVCYTNTSLTTNSTYYYTFRATNATTNVWATPSWMFLTPVPDNPHYPYSWSLDQTNVVLQVDGGNTGTIYTVLGFSGNLSNAPSVLYQTSNTAFFTYINTNALGSADRRFYLVAETTLGVTTTNSLIFTAFRKQLDTNAWYKFALGIDYGASNRLNSALGSQLAQGLTGSNASANADLFYLLDTNGDWQTCYLNGSGSWRDYNSGNSTNTTVLPWQSFWIKRRIAGVASEPIYSGYCFSNAAPLTFRSNDWHMITWPLPWDRKEGDGSDKGWGFAAAGAKKGGSWLSSDVLTVGDGAGLRFYYMNTNGRWSAVGQTTPASTVTFHIGEAYYYLHRGTGFTWTATGQ